MKRRNLVAVGVAVLLPVLLGACREGEQGRPTNLTPGVYMGKKSAPLSEPAQTALRERALRQAGVDASQSVGGPTASRTADVRPPGASTIKGRLSGQNY